MDKHWISGIRLTQLRSCCYILLVAERFRPARLLRCLITDFATRLKKNNAENVVDATLYRALPCKRQLMPR